MSKEKADRPRGSKQTNRAAESAKERDVILKSLLDRVSKGLNRGKEYGIRLKGFSGKGEFKRLEPTKGFGSTGEFKQHEPTIVELPQEEPPFGHESLTVYEITQDNLPPYDYQPFLEAINRDIERLEEAFKSISARSERITELQDAMDHILTAHSL